MKTLKSILCIALSVSAILCISAQNKPYKFHGNPDYYIECQRDVAFKMIDEGLDAFPPVVGAPIERRLALCNLDCLLHDTSNDNTEAFCNFVRSRISKVLADLERPMKRGVRIYKLYNDAFIVRTKSVTVAFDISRCRCRGHKDPIVPTDMAEKLVAKCDVMFLTHKHGDHVDRHVVEQFVKAGKPVVATPNILTDMEGITHRRAEDGVDRLGVTLKSGKELQVVIFPGFQGKLLNNVYVVTTPEKYTVCHTGDMSGKSNFKWLDSVKKEAPEIDALMVNCWTGKIAKVIEKYNPRYVVTGHENEMGHSIDHREAFWLTFAKLAPVKYDYVVTAWGEWFTIK